MTIVASMIFHGHYQIDQGEMLVIEQSQQTPTNTWAEVDNP